MQNPVDFIIKTAAERAECDISKLPFEAQNMMRLMAADIYHTYSQTSLGYMRGKQPTAERELRFKYADIDPLDPVQE